MEKDIYSYVLNEITNYETVKVPITSSVEWNMKEHIERCTNVSNGWYHSGNNDGSRPYEDIVTPILNVAKRSEGFDVKDIIPFVNDVEESYKSFLVKKFHPQWARKNQLDSFIDEVVETSIVYDLVIVKDVNQKRPEVVKLQSIAFCDQTDFLGGPFALRHQYSPQQLLEFKGKWNDEEIDNVITLAKARKIVSQAKGREVQTPGKYVETYEVRGYLPESWLYDDGDPDKYVPQMHIITYYQDQKGNKQGITLYKGKSKPIDQIFKTLVISPVFGRAAGKSIVETLFEPQVWRNYSAIKIKKMLDSAVNIFQTSDPEIANQPLSNIKENYVLKHSDGKPLTRVDGNLQNLGAFTNYQIQKENDARILGSASDAQLGTNPVAGTPFALQSLVVQQGQGIHEYRQGKIATFFADVLYPELILKYIVDEINAGKTFSEELTAEEMQEIGDKVAECATEKQVIDAILNGKVVTETDRQNLISLYKQQFMKSGNRKFFEFMKGELDEIPVEVFVNIKGKQKDMAALADKLTNILRTVMANPQAFSQIPGIGKTFNELLENSGLSPIDYSQMTKPATVVEPTQSKQVPSPVASPPSGVETINNK